MTTPAIPTAATTPPSTAVLPSLGLSNTRMFPVISTFSEPIRLPFLQGGILPTLNTEEAEEWRAAVEQAEADGTFFISTPFHCAVGAKPWHMR